MALGSTGRPGTTRPAACPTPSSQGRLVHPHAVSTNAEWLNARRAFTPHILGWAGSFSRVSNEPQSTTAWARGALGEERLGKRLDQLRDRGVLMLHDRRIPGSRANLDHIAISPAGVFVIDAKRYQGRPRLRIEGGLIRPRTQTLMVGGRDCTKLVTGITKQVALVQSAVDGLPLTETKINPTRRSDACRPRNAEPTVLQTATTTIRQPP